MSVTQINASLQAALSSVGYPTNTTIAQVKQEFITLSASLNTLNNSVNALPTSNISTVQLLAVVPQGIAVAVSTTRTTVIIKNLSSPVTQEDGTYLVTTIQNLQTPLLNFIAGGSLRIPSIEAAIPGLSNLGLNTLKNVVDGLAQALIAAVPSPSDKSSIQAIQHNLDAAIQAAYSRIPA